MIGPLSDAFGRRRPLLAGLALHVVARRCVRRADTSPLLGALRVLQGLGAAAGAVVAMAVVRDLFSGRARPPCCPGCMLVMGAGPVSPRPWAARCCAGPPGGVSSSPWPSSGCCSPPFAALALPETLPAERRRPRACRPIAWHLPRAAARPHLRRAGPRRRALDVGAVRLRRRLLVRPPGRFGLERPSSSAWCSAPGALPFLIGGTQLNAALLRPRFEPRALLPFALMLGTVAGARRWSSSPSLDVGGLVGVLAPLWTVLFSVGLAMPNTPALALARHGEAAGTAAALLGASQFVIGGAAAPLIGVMGSGSAVPMALVMATTASLAAVVAARTLRVTGRQRLSQCPGERLRQPALAPAGRDPPLGWAPCVNGSPPSRATRAGCCWQPSCSR